MWPGRVKKQMDIYIFQSGAARENDFAGAKVKILRLAGK